MLGSYGAAILLVSLLAAGTIIGAYVLAYAAHCFLTVVEQTAAGGRDIDWPDEPFHDWLWKAFYLLWLSAICLVPVSLLARLIGGALVQQLCVVAGLFVLYFPVGLLSSLSAHSKWMIVSWPVLRRLGRIAHRLLVFYLAV